MGLLDLKEVGGSSGRRSSSLQQSHSRKDLKANLQKNIHRMLDSASGTSAVAIDNKIEQAMDLVKSHLMFAVREEVEVLKEKISELMDRINQLEYENNILKQNASQETLSQLTPSGTPSAAQSAQTTAGAAAASVAAALTPLAKSQAAAAAAAASASSAAAAAGTPTVNPNANGSVS